MVSEDFSEMCEVDKKQKRNALLFMKKGPAQTLFLQKTKLYDTFESFTLLRSWYNLEEKQSRLFTEWKDMRLTR